MAKIKLEGGIELPAPKNASGFARPLDVSDYRWRSMRPEMWQRAYTHCLFSLHNLFELPLHSVVPYIAKNMLESNEPFLVALRFMGEMELQGYIKFNRGFDERIVVPTKKLLNLKIAEKEAPDTVVVMPNIVGEEYMSKYIAVRGGRRSPANLRAARVVNDMSDERFIINDYTLDLLKKYPVEKDAITDGCMYARTLTTAEQLKDKVFRFPYFLDSRGRMYSGTTCGISPQGADHEKALLLPVYAERLTTDGFMALFETATGYAEQDWDFTKMAGHAKHPELHEKEWKTADKPYSYMATANLIAQYLDDPTRPLPAFIPLDGRCSGLQHWSAVIRSNAITRHLGMNADESSLDIYERVALEWCETLEEAHKYLATRKAAKIPVMTWAYNATQMTSMAHMDKLYGTEDKWDVDTESYQPTREGFPRAVTGHLGRDLYNRLNETLGPLTAAVEWVSDSATIIAKEGNVDIEWPTPDGFECVQRKVKGDPKALKVVLSNKASFKLSILDFSGQKSDSRKHRSAIAPNIIHSLDATHLRMVAKKLKMLGSPMIFIHDSFATHVNFRASLYKEIIDAFITLYSREYLLDLKKYWEKKYKVELPDQPKLGDWEPESLRDLTNFFM